VRQRATAIHLLHLGHPPEAVAEMLAVGTSTIWTWHRRWRSDGLDGLVNQARSGRPAKATAAYVQQLDAVIQKDPAALGLNFALWTMNRLRLYLAEQTGILLSYTRFRALLAKQRYVWREPKHDLSALQDKDAQAVAQEVLDWMKKHRASSHRVRRTPLYGRNDCKFAPAAAALLEETWTAQVYSRAGNPRICPGLWSLQLAQWRGRLAHRPQEEQRSFHRLLGATYTDGLSSPALDPGAG
jgi:transposase